LELDLPNTITVLQPVDLTMLFAEPDLRRLHLPITSQVGQSTFRLFEFIL
jgi:hypothetical protein